MAELPGKFATLLRALRTGANLTQEELARAAGLSPRSVSDLERGINLTARRATARLLADALGLSGAVRAEFEAAAQGRTDAGPGDADPGHDRAVMRTLPRDVSHFTGRVAELRALVEAATGGSLSGTVVAIGGMAGIGKTSLTVHAAHELAPHFPDGQIFLPLHGHAPGRRPVSSAEALASLLRMVGVPPSQIPADVEERASMWRNQTAGMRLLLVLDDAVGTDQVRPLLPGTAGCVVLVTSRRHLIALEDAMALGLRTLPPDEAVMLLIRLADRAGLNPEDSALAEIARLCGYLPLALGMIARQLRHHPAWTPTDVADDLAAARGRLELMVTESSSVTLAFNLSYDDLTPGQRLMFRRLGLHPGTDIDAYAAAALAGTDLAAARRCLAGLYDHHLLTEPVRGRYLLHDLIREHASALAAADPAAEIESAMSRLFGYYQQTAETAARHIRRHTRSTPAGCPVPSVPDLPDLSDMAHALSWARAERANLLACLDQLNRDQTGRIADDRWLIALTASLAPLLRHDGPWADGMDRQAAAAAAARRVGDRHGEADALNELGMLHNLAGDYPLALSTLETALAIYRELGDRLGQANCVYGLGRTLRRMVDYSAAAQMLTDALDAYRDLGDQRGEAGAWNDLGIVRYQTGEYSDAIDALKESQHIYVDLGDPQGQASALSGLGSTYWRSGRFTDAADALQSALAIYRDLGDRSGQASALSNLGALWLMTADYAKAIDALESALAIATAAGDRLAQANANNFLGFALRQTGDLDGALAALEATVNVSTRSGDRQGEASALHQIGVVRYLMGEVPEAFEAARKSLRIYRDLGNRHGQADSLLDLGFLRRVTGDHVGADSDLTAALGFYRELGQENGEADTLNELGELHLARGDAGRAEDCHRQALDLSRGLASRHNLANSLAGLGRCALARGHFGEAEESLRQALDIYQRIGVTDAKRVVAELEALPGARPSPM